ncbi:hypothetical protein IGS73_03930 [Janibacter indicus]|uniref:Uncharacterized protein n=1 Tax=Janibacter indicus TaxID=857417 RepID=A0A7L9J2V2_9MICO|nr:MULTISPECIES: hypothetical protein [Janibacter]QNF94939.1 hypothetical protein H7A72_03870 [Janibacter sp. YB324]QOK23562.1 hypothetical protein IGS73_03930 [Janibacter indicus]
MTAVTLESRGPADDQRDIDFVNVLRGGQRVDPSVRVEHVVGRDEPLLWIPDTVCGMVTSQRLMGANHIDVLDGRITIIDA